MDLLIFQPKVIEMSNKTWDFQGLKGYLVPVSERFGKNSLAKRHPTIDEGYKLCAVISWATGTVKLTAVHGIAGTLEEFRGEELWFPFRFRTGGDQDAGLQTLRLVQAYLDRFEPEFDGAVKETVKQVFFGRPARYACLCDEEAVIAAEADRESARKIMREAIGAAETVNR